MFIPRWHKYANRKPTGKVSLNRNNPLTDGLQVAVLHGEAPVINYATDGVLRSQGIVQVGTTAGVGTISPVYNAANFIEIPALPTTTWPGVTVVSHLFLPALSAVNPLANILTCVDLATNVRHVSLECNYNNDSVYSLHMEHTDFIGPGFVSFERNGTVVASFTRTGGRIFIDTLFDRISMRRVSIGNSPVLRPPATHNFIGYREVTTGGHRTNIHPIYLTLLYSRGLSIEESSELLQYPYQIFKPRGNFFLLPKPFTLLAPYSVVSEQANRQNSISSLLSLATNELISLQSSKQSGLSGLVNLPASKVTNQQIHTSTTSLSEAILTSNSLITLQKFTNPVLHSLQNLVPKNTVCEQVLLLSEIITALLLTPQPKASIQVSNQAGVVIEGEVIILASNLLVQQLIKTSKFLKISSEHELNGNTVYILQTTPPFLIMSEEIFLTLP